MTPLQRDRTEHRECGQRWGGVADRADIAVAVKALARLVAWFRVRGRNYSDEPGLICSERGGLVAREAAGPYRIQQTTLAVLREGRKGVLVSVIGSELYCMTFVSVAVDFVSDQFCASYHEFTGQPFIVLLKQSVNQH